MLKFNSKSYFNYKETTDFLKAAQKNYPDFITIESIGLSAEKRKTWLVSLTNHKTGRPEDKPSLWIDANTHASEITGAQSCLYFIYKTLTGMKKNSDLQFLLDHMNFYILPQVSPDGAEFYLKNNYEIRSAPQTWPTPEAHENIAQQDLDGDGEILTVRKLDPSGGYKTSPENPDLLVQRGAFDLPTKNQKYYSLYQEGLFKNHDGFNENQEAIARLDFNRQFPSHFRPEGQQLGASAYPMSSPEIRNFVKAFVDRARIFGHIALHTYGGLILQPPEGSPEHSFDLTDMTILTTICREAAQVSGYSALQTAKDFKYYSREVESGTAVDWSFEQRGVYAFTVEIWDVWKAAGIDVKDHVSRYFKPLESDLVKIFKWAQSKLKLKDFYSKWKPFNHPQLGPVEIGGWKIAYLFRNPPPSFLEGEMEKVNNIILQFAKVLPVIKIKSSHVTRLNENTSKLVVVIENQGFLPTHGSQQAVRVASVTQPTVHLKTSAKLKLVAGKKYLKLHHLQGRNRFVPIHTPIRVFRSTNSHQCQLEWVFQGHGDVGLEFDFQRGGVLKAKVQI